MLNKAIAFFLENKLVTFLLVISLILWGIISAPFGWDLGFLPSDPVPVDAIPDIGENQQIVYSEWPGHSPQDMDDQVSYPLTTSLLGIPGVKTIRSQSIFGLSSIYIIFKDDVEFYWSRSRILEKMNSLPKGTLPEGVTPSLGPDATALGQIFWYTLEGRNSEGHPAGGWDPHELRTIQDFFVKYALTSVEGVAEVASIGGYVQEYQVDIDPDAMKAAGVTLAQIIRAVSRSNQDIGARSIEINRVEYLLRVLGTIKDLDDLKKSVVAVNENVPVRLDEVAKVQMGPASRRGGLDKDGVEVAGGVVVARFGSNPLQVINRVKEKIADISAGLPERELPDGTVSKVSIVPFYDRSGLIRETLGTLEEALTLEILITILVVLILVFNLRASLLISSLLPIGVLMTFVLMRHYRIDANIVALSGIAIAIGVMVDVGIVFMENITRHLSLPENRDLKGVAQRHIIFQATIEVAPAVITAIFTTVISFLPVFALQASEGKLFRPLAFTKTFGMLSALVIGLFIIPALANLLFSIRIQRQHINKGFSALLFICAFAMLFTGRLFISLALTAYGVNMLKTPTDGNRARFRQYITIAITMLIVLNLLTRVWTPLGADRSDGINILFVILLISIILGFLIGVKQSYNHILTWSLRHKGLFLLLPLMVILLGFVIWLGHDKVFAFMPSFVQKNSLWHAAGRIFPGLGKEFMPALNEGSFLLMPTTMPHSGIEENIETIGLLDKRISSIPEVDSVVGKWGRVNSALDPAPISMFENLINYKSEYLLNDKGRRQRFRFDHPQGFALTSGGHYLPSRDGYQTIPVQQLIPDDNGRILRQWRPHILTSDAIWQEIVKLTPFPGLTSAPKLQPIQTRLVMLQTGMRAPMGYKVFGPDLSSIEKAGYLLEKVLKEVPGVDGQSVFADRVVGKPYLEVHLDRESMARYGITVQDLQQLLRSGIGGMPLTTTLEGRERYTVRVRYPREFRDNPEELMKILIPVASGQQVPLSELARIEFTRGPQMIKSEDTFLVGYVIFDKTAGYAEVDVIENCVKHINHLVHSDRLKFPPGVHVHPTGNYENQVRASQRLLLVIPVSLLVIFLILYFQFRSVIASALVFSGTLVAFSGGFIMLWLSGPNGLFLSNLEINMSVAVWVGFIALFGIATDDGVLISTYLKQLFDKKNPDNVAAIRETVLEAGQKRVRPAIMTTATTLIALLPVLSSNGKGSDIMIPMALPIFGGMVIAVLTIFMVPVLYSLWQEFRLTRKYGKEVQ